MTSTLFCLRWLRCDSALNAIEPVSRFTYPLGESKSPPSSERPWLYTARAFQPLSNLCSIVAKAVEMSDPQCDQSAAAVFERAQFVWVPSLK